MKRPIPIILTAILLGLLALLQILGALGIAAVGFFTFHKGFPQPSTQLPSPFPPSFLPVMMFAISLFYVALAVWSILTLVGLVRLRTRARYSILVMAGLVGAFSAIGAIITIAMPFLNRGMVHAQPTPQPPFASTLFLIMAAVQLIVAAIAIALLIYYNLTSTRALFQQYAPLNLDPPNTSTGRPRPTAIAIISWFYLVTAPFTLIYAFFPLPALFLGFMFYGWAAHFFFATNALLCFAIGYGLFRLREPARIAFFAWSAFGLLNMLAVLTPWGNRNFQTYMGKYTIHAASAPTAPIFATHGITFFIFFIAATFIVILIWLLHRHRIAFTPLPPPPPRPLSTYDAPLAG